MLVQFNSELNTTNRRSDWKRFINRIFSGDLGVAYAHSQTTHAPVPKTKTYQTLTSSANVTMNTNLGVNAKITLAHSMTITLSNLVSGDEGNIVITQAAGNYTVDISPTPKVIDGDGSGAVVITDGAGSITTLCYTYDGTNLLINYAPYK
ncbi:MAG: hypothetical protein M0R17_04605 [Candidatus Omnitrophica bacterium]|jgi:hypothetical protein|nr:hypothetical protein [Candidatus Omnitrophota bacterium]